MNREDREEEMTETSALSQHNDNASEEEKKRSSTPLGHSRTLTPTNIGLSYSTSTSSSPVYVGLRTSSPANTPKPGLQPMQPDLDYVLSPPWVSSSPSPGPSLRLSSLYDGQSENSFPNGTSSQNQSHLSLAAFLPPQTPGEHPARPGKELPPGAIRKLHERDDADVISGPQRFARRAAPVVTLLACAAYVLYVTFRIYCVVDSQRVTGKTYWPAWIFIAVELATAIPSMIHNIWTMMAFKRRRRPKLRLVCDDVDIETIPTVDIFITCCGEDDELVLDTVRAACDVDYPRSRCRVVLLDDGKSEGLEKACAQMNTVFGNVVYISRPKYPGVPHHFKSGNLNYGLEAVTQLPGGAGEYFAALDADMIPEKHWLRALMPHLLVDPKMALACPPQLFYNTPRSDPLSQNLDFFVHVIEPIKDSLGVAWCTGSGYVVRREAIDDIGHFPLGSLAEDVATSTLMLGRGWKTAYIHEPLQFGTVPEDYASHIKQRTRWAIGTVDTSFKLNFCLWGEKVRRMTLPQRFSGFLYSFLSMYSILYSISLFSIPIILVMGNTLVAYATINQLRWLIRLCFIQLITSRIGEVLLFMPAGYHNGQRGSRYHLWMAPYISMCLIRAFILPKWLGGKAQAFTPTGSLQSSLNERDPKRRRNVFVRLWTILIQCHALYHLAFVYLTLVGVTFSSYRCIAENTTVRDVLWCLVTHAFWPPLTFLFLCTSLWTPIGYAIFPPSVPDREKLLVRDAKTGVAHPTEKSKKVAFGGQAAWFELEYTLSTVYTCLIFVASFII